MTTKFAVTTKIAKISKQATYFYVTRVASKTDSNGLKTKPGNHLILVKMVHMQNQMIKIWTHDRTCLCIQSRQT